MSFLDLNLLVNQTCQRPSDPEDFRERRGLKTRRQFERREESLSVNKFDREATGVVRSLENVRVLSER